MFYTLIKHGFSTNQSTRSVLSVIIRIICLIGTVMILEGEPVLITHDLEGFREIIVVFS